MKFNALFALLLMISFTLANVTGEGITAKDHAFTGKNGAGTRNDKAFPGKDGTGKWKKPAHKIISDISQADKKQATSDVKAKLKSLTEK